MDGSRLIFLQIVSLWKAPKVFLQVTFLKRRGSFFSCFCWALNILEKDSKWESALLSLELISLLMTPQKLQILLFQSCLISLDRAVLLYTKNLLNAILYLSSLYLEYNFAKRAENTLSLRILLIFLTSSLLALSILLVRPLVNRLKILSAPCALRSYLK